jgi:hypothetical protein
MFRPTLSRRYLSTNSTEGQLYTQGQLAAPIRQD